MYQNEKMDQYLKEIGVNKFESVLLYNYFYEIITTSSKMKDLFNEQLDKALDERNERDIRRIIIEFDIRFENMKDYVKRLSHQLTKLLKQLDIVPAKDDLKD